jgi:hypothetical protein
MTVIFSPSMSTMRELRHRSSVRTLLTAPLSRETSSNL